MTSWIKQHFHAAMNQSKSSIIVMRHAHRLEHSQGTFGNDFPLTLEGRKAAEQMGKSLAEMPLGEVHTSPLPRCVQTVEELLRGAGQQIPVFSSKVLGNPGPFVADSEAAGEVFLNNPLQAIAQEVADGKKNIPGMRTLAEAGKLFVNHVGQVKRFPCLMITHDIVISLLCCFFFGSKDVQKYFPQFLEGFALDMHLKGASIFYRQERCDYLFEVV